MKKKLIALFLIPSLFLDAACASALTLGSGVAPCASESSVVITEQAFALRAGSEWRPRQSASARLTFLSVLEGSSQHSQQKLPRPFYGRARALIPVVLIYQLALFTDLGLLWDLMVSIIQPVPLATFAAIALIGIHKHAKKPERANVLSLMGIVWASQLAALATGAILGRLPIFGTVSIYIAAGFPALFALAATYSKNLSWISVAGFFGIMLMDLHWVFSGHSAAGMLIWTYAGGLLLTPFANRAANRALRTAV